MTSSFTWIHFAGYLVEASFCTGAFALAYRLLFARLTCFAWNRAYLLFALGVSILLPVLALPVFPLPVDTVVDGSSSTAFGFPWPLLLPSPAVTVQVTTTSSLGQQVGWILVGIYLLGCSYKLWQLSRQLGWIFHLIGKHQKTKQADYWLVDVPQQTLPAFSFGRFIFLSPAYQQLSPAERHLVLTHERLHVRQHHTLDLLCYELGRILFWYNPLVTYLQKQLQQVHEYLADGEVTSCYANRKSYGELLLKLSLQSSSPALLHSFSSKQLFARIMMLTKTPATARQKCRFLLLFPLVAFTWLATACVDAPTSTPPEPTSTPSLTGKKGGFTIGKISWLGNTIVSTQTLNERLGLKVGDQLDSLALQQRLQLLPDGKDITSLYMDQGYMFFQLTPILMPLADGSIALELRITEGKPVQIGKIAVTGTHRLTTAQVLRMIPLQSGEWFSRAKLLQAQKNLAQAGEFDPTQVNLEIVPRPQPGESMDITDITFSVVEKL